MFLFISPLSVSYQKITLPLVNNSGWVISNREPSETTEKRQIKNVKHSIYFNKYIVKNLLQWYNGITTNQHHKGGFLMLKDKNNQLSIYSILYNKIPENHILKLINNAIDFSFINKLLEKSYCKYYGRPAKEPELMLRLLILQYLYNLSDERVIEEASLNLAYLWFLGINREEELPHPSLLAKFRVHRLQEVTMDEIDRKSVV